MLKYAFQEGATGYMCYYKIVEGSISRKVRYFLITMQNLLNASNDMVAMHN